MLKLFASILVVFILSYPLVVFLDAGIDATLNLGEFPKLFIALGCIALFNLGYDIGNSLWDKVIDEDNEDV